MYGTRNKNLVCCENHFIILPFACLLKGLTFLIVNKDIWTTTNSTHINCLYTAEKWMKLSKTKGGKSYLLIVRLVLFKLPFLRMNFTLFYHQWIISPFLVTISGTYCHQNLHIVCTLEQNTAAWIQPPIFFHFS